MLTNESFTMLNIKKRIFIGFFTITLFILIAISIILIKIINVKHFSEQITSRSLPAFNAYIDLNSSMYKTEADIFGFLLTHAEKYKLEREQTWNLLKTTISKIDEHGKSLNNSQYSRHWNVAYPLFLKLKETQDNIEKAAASLINTNNAIYNIDTQMLPILNTILDHIDGPLTMNGNRIGGMYDIYFYKIEADCNKIINDMNTVEITLFVLLGIVVLLSYIVAMLTARAINNYITIFRQHSSNIAMGDLTKRLSISSNDELGQLGNDLNSMTESLANTIKKIAVACHNMVTTLEEVKHSVDIQSAGATEQAASINEITASLEEIEKSSIQTIDKAKALGEASERTRTKGQQGLDAVQQSTKGMKIVREKVQIIAQNILELSNQSQQVGEITASVNNLAQQSKMLALNASIEAAKAGEAGKGFAVVATEVKHLAEESERSTIQVQKILSDIRHATEKAVMATEEGIKEVDNGTKLVEETGEIVRNLSDVIHEATIASQQIEAAIRQEGIGIEQITAGMNEINQVTYSFVESVKQTTEAIKHLSVNVQNLKKYMDIYKI